MSRETILIEPARFSDAADIVGLSRDYIEFGLRWSWNRARVVRAISSSSTMVYVARLNRRLVGFGIMDYYKHRANLSLLAVDRGHRRTGIGSRLVENLETIALDRGLENLYVQVRQGNRKAIRFYNRIGYEQIDLTKRYYQRKENAVILYKCLGNY